MITSKYPALRRFIALSVSCTFLLTQTPAPVSASPSYAVVTVPEQWGKLESSVAGSLPKTILFIQDAHESLEAQQNIAELIREWVERYGVKRVYEEGYAGPVPTEKYFGSIQDKELRKRIGYFFMDQLRMGGAEYAHLVHPGRFDLIGVENAAWYEANLKSYRQVLALEKEIQKDFELLEYRLEEAGRQFFTEEQKKGILLFKQWEQQKISFLDYLEGLRSLSGKSENDFKKYPALEALLLLKKQSLKKEKSKTDELKKISGTHTVEELTRFQKEVFEKIQESAGPEIGKIFKWRNGLFLLDKMNRLRLSPSEFRETRQTLEEMKTAEVVDALAHIQKRPVVLSRFWEEGLKAAAAFYETANSRDASLKDYLRDFASDPALGTHAVLVYGGFHKQNILAMLAEMGFSYYVVQPRISNVGELKTAEYRYLMAEDRYDYEKNLLERNTIKTRNAYDGILEPAGSNAFGVVSRYVAAAEETRSLRLETTPGAMRKILTDSHGFRTGGKRSETRMISIPWEKDEKRILVAGQNEEIDRLDAYLFEKTKKEGKNYVRLRVRNREDYQKLVRLLQVDPDGKVSREAGPLRDVILDGGVLLLDSSGSTPVDLEIFNPLFDAAAFLEEMSASPQLQVYVGLHPDDIPNYANTVGSRSFNADLDSLQMPDFEDPIETWREEELEADETGPEDATVISLNESPKYRETLLGKVAIDASGRVRYLEGEQYGDHFYGLLTEAARGNTKKTIVIQGARWQDEDFLFLMRQIGIRKGFYANGEWVSTENLKILFQAYDPRKKITQHIQHKGTVPLEEKEELWVINGATQDLLFTTSIVYENHFMDQPGLLERKDKVKRRLRITEDLDEGVWHEIMHSGFSGIIEVEESVEIPHVYHARLLPRASRKETVLTNEEARKVRIVEGEDFPYIRVKIREDNAEKYSNNIYFFPVSAQSPASSFFEEIVELESEAYGYQEKEILQKLRSGSLVVIEGIDAQPKLGRFLEGLFSERPYLVINGKYVLLSDLHPDAQIIFMRKTAKNRPVFYEKSQRVDIQDLDEKQEYNRILAKEFSKKFGDQWDTVFSKAWQLLTVFREAAEADPQAKPFKLSLGKLRILFRTQTAFKSWPDAFQTAFGVDDAHQPFFAAYRNLQVRLAFGQDFLGRPSNGVEAQGLFRLLNELPRDGKWTDAYWQWLDLLDLKTLFELDKISPLIGDIQNQNNTAGFALLADLFKDQGDWLRRRYDFEPTAPDGITIELNPEALPDYRNPEKRLERIKLIASVHPLLFFRGAPGTGKSYLLRPLAETFGFIENEIFGPFTTGSHAQMRELEKREDGLGGFAKAKRGVLLWDEANLAGPDFANFLRGFTEDAASIQKIILMTGNDTDEEGRDVINAIEEEGVILPFPEFEEPFFRKTLKEYLAKVIPDEELRTQRLETIWKMHSTFVSMKPSAQFSLRELQEVVNRLAAFNAFENEKDLIDQVWQVYSGRFEEEDCQALRLWIQYQFDVDLSLYEDVRSTEAKKKYKNMDKVILTDSTAEYFAVLDEQIALREARIQGRLPADGKRSVLVLGPSGWGKDFSLEEFLKAEVNGFTKAPQSMDEIRANHSPGEGKFYYLLSGSMKIEDLRAVIFWAKTHGIVLALREMNFIKTGILEGELNDLLAGGDKKIHPGFLFIGTMNGLDFSGRRRVGSPMLSRSVVFIPKVHDEKNLREIAQGHAAKQALVKPEDVEALIVFHQQVYNLIEAQQDKPTLRELLRALDFMKAYELKDWKNAAQLAYGFLLKHRLGKNVDEVLAQPVTPVVHRDDLLYLEKFINLIIPKHLGTFELANHPQANSPRMDKKEKKFILTPDAIRREEAFILRVIFNMVSGYIFSGPAFETELRAFFQEEQEKLLEMFDRFLEGENESWKGSKADQNGTVSKVNLYSDLQSIWAKESLKRVLPGITADHLTAEAKNAASIVIQKDFGALSRWIQSEKTPLTERGFFRYLLVAYVSGEVTREQLESFAAELDKDNYDFQNGANPAAVLISALGAVDEFLSTAARSREESTIQKAQMEALKGMAAIAAFYDELPLALPAVPEDSDTPASDTLMDALQKFKRSEKPDPGQLNAAREALKDAQFNKLKRIIETELEKIDKSLAAGNNLKKLPPAVLNAYEKRLQQMLEQLTDPKHARPLVLWGKDLEKLAAGNPDREQKLQTIRERMESLKRQIEAKKQEIQQEKADREEFKQMVDELQKVIPPGINMEDFFSRLSGGAPEAPLPSEASDFSLEDLLPEPELLFSQDHQPPQELDPNLFTSFRPEEIHEASVIVPVAIETERDKRFAKLRVKYRKILEKKAALFSFLVTDSGKVDSADGNVDPELLLLTGNPEASRRTMDSVPAREKQDLIILGGGTMTPFMEEIFDFLFELGFKVTVLLDAQLISPPITSLEALRGALRIADAFKLEEEGYRRSELEKEVRRSRKFKAPALKTLKEIQEVLEGAFLYGARKLIQTGEDEGAEPEDVQAENEKERPVFSEDQILADEKALKQWLTEKAKIEKIDDIIIREKYGLVLNLSPLAVNMKLALALAELPEAITVRTFKMTKSGLDRSLVFLPDILEKLPNIVDLDLSSSQLGAGEMDSFPRLPFLKRLNLTGNRHPFGTVKGLNYSENFPQLKELILAHTGFEFEDLEALRGLKLWRLDLSGNENLPEREDAFFRPAVGTEKGMEVIWPAGANSFEILHNVVWKQKGENESAVSAKQIDEDYETIKNWLLNEVKIPQELLEKVLVRQDLGLGLFFPLTDKKVPWIILTPEHWDSLLNLAPKSLIALDIGMQTSLTNSLEDTLQALPNLHWLILTGMNLTEADLERMPSLKNLQALELSKNPDIKDYSSLGKFERLSRVDVSHSGLTAGKIYTLASVEALENLELSGNPGLGDVSFYFQNAGEGKGFTVTHSGKPLDNVTWRLSKENAPPSTGDKEQSIADYRKLAEWLYKTFGASAIVRVSDYITETPNGFEVHLNRFKVDRKKLRSLAQLNVRISWLILPDAPTDDIKRLFTDPVDGNHINVWYAGEGGNTAEMGYYIWSDEALAPESKTPAEEEFEKVAEWFGNSFPGYGARLLEFVTLVRHTNGAVKGIEIKLENFPAPVTRIHLKVLAQLNVTTLTYLSLPEFGKDISDLFMRVTSSAAPYKPIFHLPNAGAMATWSDEAFTLEPEVSSLEQEQKRLMEWFEQTFPQSVVPASLHIQTNISGGLDLHLQVLPVEARHLEELRAMNLTYIKMISLPEALIGEMDKFFAPTTSDDPNRIFIRIFPKPSQFYLWKQPEADEASATSFAKIEDKEPEKSVFGLTAEYGRLILWLQENFPGIQITPQILKIEGTQIFLHLNSLPATADHLKNLAGMKLKYLNKIVLSEDLADKEIDNFFVKTNLNNPDGISVETPARSKGLYLWKQPGPEFNINIDEIDELSEDWQLSAETITEEYDVLYVWLENNFGKEAAEKHLRIITLPDGKRILRIVFEGPEVTRQHLKSLAALKLTLLGQFVVTNWQGLEESHTDLMQTVSGNEPGIEFYNYAYSSSTPLDKFVWSEEAFAPEPEAGDAFAADRAKLIAWLEENFVFTGYDKPAGRITNSADSKSRPYTIVLLHNLKISRIALKKLAQLDLKTLPHLLLPEKPDEDIANLFVPEELSERFDPKNPKGFKVNYLESYRREPLGDHLESLFLWTPEAVTADPPQAEGETFSQEELRKDKDRLQAWFQEKVKISFSQARGRKMIEELPNKKGFALHFEHFTSVSSLLNPEMMAALPRLRTIREFSFEKHIDELKDFSFLSEFPGLTDLAFQNMNIAGILPHARNVRDLKFLNLKGSYGAIAPDYLQPAKESEPHFLVITAQGASPMKWKEQPVEKPFSQAEIEAEYRELRAWLDRYYRGGPIDSTLLSYNSEGISLQIKEIVLSAEALRELAGLSLKTLITVTAHSKLINALGYIKAPNIKTVSISFKTITSVAGYTITMPDNVNEILRGLPALEKMEVIQLMDVEWGIEHLEGLRRFGNLKKLHLESATLTDSALKSLPHLPQLETIYLSQSILVHEYFREAKGLEKGFTVMSGSVPFEGRYWKSSDELSDELGKLREWLRTEGILPEERGFIREDDPTLMVTLNGANVSRDQFKALMKLPLKYLKRITLSDVPVLDDKKLYRPAREGEKGFDLYVEGENLENHVLIEDETEGPTDGTLVEKILKWGLVNPAAAEAFVRKTFEDEGGAEWLDRYLRKVEERAAEKREASGTTMSTAYGTGFNIPGGNIPDKGNGTDIPPARSEMRRITGEKRNQAVLNWHRKIQGSHEDINFVIRAGAGERFTEEQWLEYETIMAWNSNAKVYIWGVLSLEKEARLRKVTNRFQGNFGDNRFVRIGVQESLPNLSGRVVAVDRINKGDKVAVPDAVRSRRNLVKAAYLGKEVGLAIAAAYLSEATIQQLNQRLKTDYISMESSAMVGILRDALLYSVFGSAA